MPNTLTIVAEMVIPFCSLVVIYMTWVIYKRILRVSEHTLLFTKNQTSFSSYLDNFKLYNELSKRKVSIVLEGELYCDQIFYFENMTFETMHINYMNILKYFPLVNKNHDETNYEFVFKRFNYKIQSFLDILYNEITSVH